MSKSLRPSRTDALIEIENRARLRDRRARRTFGLPAGRTRDLTRFFAFTYSDALPDDDGGREDFLILAHHVARLNGDPARNIIGHADRWCPWMDADEIAATVRRVLARPYRWTADILGERLGLLDEVRTRLAIRTIGAIDVPKAAREQRREQRKVQAKKAKRRAQGVMLRDQYEANSFNRTKPWEAAGISRATWYRRRENEPLTKRTPVRQVARKTGLTPNKRFSIGWGHTCLTPTPQQAAREQRARRELVRFFLSALSTSGPNSEGSWVRAAP
jgi:hypothetical protein